MSLAHFGVTPFNSPLFRVVWAESVLHTVGGKWKDGNVEYRSVPRYPGTKAFVLEKWLSAFEFGGSPATYEITQKDAETGLLVTGPYPAEGIYEHCYTFPGMPTASAVETHIQQTLYGRKFSLRELRQAHLDVEKKNVLDWENRNRDIWKDSQGAFNNRPSNVNPGKKTADKVQFKKLAEDLNLPVGDNKFFQH